jgi:hypothetical protein
MMEEFSMQLAECQIRPGLRIEIPDIVEVCVATYAQYRDEVPAAVFDAGCRPLLRRN